MKRNKPSGAKRNKLQSSTKSKNFMEAFVKKGTTAQYPVFSSEDSTSAEETDIEYDKNADEVSKNSEEKSEKHSLNVIGTSDELDIHSNHPEEDIAFRNPEEDDKSPNASGVNATFTKDVGTWPAKIDSSFRDLMVGQGTSRLQNIDAEFPQDDTGRSLTKTWFEKTLKNGERIARTWMCFSLIKNALFCFCCILSPPRRCQSSQSHFTNASGFSSWRKLNPRVQDHENSPAHRLAFLEWKELERILNQGGGIDDDLQRQVAEEEKYWRNILERIIVTIQTLAQQNLALRGHRESIDNLNPGNFLALLRYLAKFDPVMKSHFEHISSQPECLSYLSPRIQNELITMMGNKVRKFLISQCKDAKYYSLMFDSTPDSAHEEQMSQIIRFVEVKPNSVKIREVFIDFIPLKVKTAEGVTEAITNKLDEDELILKDCRGQSYDNAPTMAGIHTGFQQRIIDLNEQAVFVPCDNHSLNLAGVHAAHVNVRAVIFFGTIQRLFTYFSSSTHRWDVLKEYVSITVKRHCETRWSSEAEAVKPVSTQLDEVISALEHLRDTVTENIDTRQDAALVINAIETFDFIAFLFFWAEIVVSFDRVQKRLQEKGISFTYVLGQLQMLTDKLNDWRIDLCDRAICKAKEKCNELGVSIVKRIRKKRNMPGETSEDSGLDSEEEMRRSLIEILDKLSMEISTRFTNLKKLDERFGFLCNFEKIIQLPRDFYKDELLKIEGKCKKLAEFYPDVLDNEDLFNDIQDVLLLLKRAKKNEKEIGFSPEQLLLYISSMGREAYETLATALQILLTIPVSLASCERSFSKLKLIKSYLRSTMSQSRLSNLAILSIESETAAMLDYEDNF